MVDYILYFYLIIMPFGFCLLFFVVGCAGWVAALVGSKSTTFIEYILEYLLNCHFLVLVTLGICACLLDA